MMHPGWESLNDYHDGLATDVESLATQRHLEQCAECRKQLAALDALRAKVNTLPREIAASEITRVRVAASARESAKLLGGRGASQTSWRRQLFAAAALVSIAVALTRALDRRRPMESGPPIVAQPATWQVSEQGYLSTAHELRVQLEAQRNRLTPATVATIERSLNTIDTAIGEARSALLADPANAALADLLASNYRQKVDLLKRANLLAAPIS